MTLEDIDFEKVYRALSNNPMAIEKRTKRMLIWTSAVAETIKKVHGVLVTEEVARAAAGVLIEMRDSS